jgi:hypothetical protein
VRKRRKPETDDYEDEDVLSASINTNVVRPNPKLTDWVPHFIPRFPRHADLFPRLILHVMWCLGCGLLSLPCNSRSVSSTRSSRMRHNSHSSFFDSLTISCIDFITQVSHCISLWSPSTSNIAGACEKLIAALFPSASGRMNIKQEGGRTRRVESSPFMMSLPCVG